MFPITSIRWNLALASLAFAHCLAPGASAQQKSDALEHGRPVDVQLRPDLALELGFVATLKAPGGFWAWSARPVDEIELRILDSSGAPLANAVPWAVPGAQIVKADLRRGEHYRVVLRWRAVAGKTGGVDVPLRCRVNAYQVGPEKEETLRLGARLQADLEALSQLVSAGQLDQARPQLDALREEFTSIDDPYFFASRTATRSVIFNDLDRLGQLTMEAGALAEADAIYARVLEHLALLREST